jgi:multiple sugar transport system permease protein
MARIGGFGPTPGSSSPTPVPLPAPARTLTPAGQAARARRRRARLDNAVWYAVSIAIVLVFLIPIFGTILTSFKADADINRRPPTWIFAPTLVHYANVFGDAGYSFPAFFGNSLVVALGTSALVVAINLPAAYAIVRYGLGRKRLFPYVVSLRLVPPVVFIVPFFIMYQAVGLVDTLHGLILVNTLFNTPLALLLFVGFIQDLPREIEESALIDGASAWVVLTRVVFPLLLPGLAVVLVMTFLWTWNEFLFSLVLSFTDATTVTVGASLFVTAWGVRWGDIAAAITLSLLPTLLFTFLTQRYLVAGLTFGAVKE